MSDIQQHLFELNVYGFTIVEGVLSTDVAHAMREALIKCEEKFGTETAHRGTASHVANLPIMDRIFHQTIDHPRILPLLEHYLEESLILGSLNSRIVRPGDGHQGLHSDIPLHMLNSASPVMMNTVWMLDDVSPINGGTRLVPGYTRAAWRSHRRTWKSNTSFSRKWPQGASLFLTAKPGTRGGPIQARPIGMRSLAIIEKTCAPFSATHAKVFHPNGWMG